MTPDDFRAQGHRMIDWIADYWGRVEQFPVLSQSKPGEVLGRLPIHPPAKPGEDSWDIIFGDIESIILPGITHWQSPNFFGFFPCNASGPAVLGELLSAGLGVQGMLWATSPAATELETRVLDWLGGAIGLPEHFLSTSGNGGGVIQGTASEATLVAMIAARHRAGRDATGLVAYASTQAHSSVLRAAMICGIAKGPTDHEHVRRIDVDDTFAMRPEALAHAMQQDAAAGRTPFFVCATVGTTSSTAVDSVHEISRAIGAVKWQSGEVAKWQSESGGSSPPTPPLLPWLHIDAAHAGAACICPEFRWMIRGIEGADSICFNPHKWLLTNFDCDCFWTSDRNALISAMSIIPEYLRNAATESGKVIDYRDWQVPLGRRFRALKLWFVLRHYGIAGLQAHIREHVRLAALFEQWVREDPRFEVAAPRTVNLVCFRLAPLPGEPAPQTDARNKALLDSINASGRAYLTHTTLPGRGLVLRMCIGATQTRQEHVRSAWVLIQELSQVLCPAS